MHPLESAALSRRTPIPAVRNTRRDRLSWVVSCRSRFAQIVMPARVGIATGLVVVGDLIGEGSAQEQSVVGETPNLAARLQALAEPDIWSEALCDPKGVPPVLIYYRTHIS